MDQNTIRILIIGIVIILVRIIVKNIKNLRKSSVPKLSQEQLEYNKILDYITDLCINFDDNNRERYTNQQLTVISTMEYYNEVMNGGLCQFFVNSSRIFSSILSTSLEQVKAKKHKSHFDKFIKQNNLDVNNLNSFISEDVDEFIEQYDRYPFEDFDMKFYEIDETEQLCDLIVEYTKNNFDEIFPNINEHSKWQPEELKQGKVYLNLFGVKAEIETEKDVEDSYIEKCVAHLNNLDDKVIDELCRKLAVNYMLTLKSVKDYGTSEEIEEFEKQIPNKFVNREILKYITPQIIYIEPPLEDIPAYTLYCECDWEEEHGVNLIFKGDNILYFGDACCTIGPWADAENYKYELGFLKDYLNDNNLVIENLNDIFTKLSENYKVEWIKKSKNQFYLYFSKDKKDYRIYVNKSEINISEMKKQSWEELENSHFDDNIYRFLELYVEIINYIQEYNNR